MASHGPVSRLTAVEPSCACAGGLVTVRGDALPLGDTGVPEVRVAGEPVRPTAASRRFVAFRLPAGLDGGPTPVRLAGVPGETIMLNVARPLATGLHQVDSPAIDSLGRIYVTYSGSRGQQVPVSIFRITQDGTRESFSSSVLNPTSMAFSPSGVLHVSSRFEGTVYRLNDAGEAEPVVTEMGVPFGLAFSQDGTLFIGDRSGTIFQFGRSGHPAMVTTLPASVAAYHLAMGLDGWLHVTAPTLTSYDRVYRVRQDGEVRVAYSGFGRPQGLAFDGAGVLYVIEALAGASGLYRLRPDSTPELVVAGEGLVGVAFDRSGGVVLATNDTLYRLDGVPGVVPPAA
jgi:hypothetical protein